MHTLHVYSILYFILVHSHILDFLTKYYCIQHLIPISKDVKHSTDFKIHLKNLHIYMSNICIGMTAILLTANTSTTRTVATTNFLLTYYQ